MAFFRRIGVVAVVGLIVAVMGGGCSALKTDAAQSPADKAWQEYLTKKDWPWLEGYQPAAADASYVALLKEANTKRSTSREVFLQSYQRVVDSRPPADVEVMVKVEMGLALICSYEPRLDDIAIPWYIQLVEQVDASSRQLRGHRSAIVAKLQLAELLRFNESTRTVFARKIAQLHEDVLAIPEQEYVFDSEFGKRLNLANIEAATMDKKRLLEERQSEIDRLRFSAATSYAWTSLAFTPSPHVTIERLEQMKLSRPEDKIYQKALDEVIAGEKKRIPQFEMVRLLGQSK